MKRHALFVGSTTTLTPHSRISATRCRMRWRFRWRSPLGALVLVCWRMSRTDTAATARFCSMCAAQTSSPALRTGTWRPATWRLSRSRTRKSTSAHAASCARATDSGPPWVLQSHARNQRGVSSYILDNELGHPDD